MGGMFEKMLSEFLRKLYPCMIESIHNSKQKELRIIDTLEPIMNRHKLIIDTNIIRQDNLIEDKNYSLIYQLTRISKTRGSLKHDDKLDVLAMAASYFTNNMGIDEKDAIERIEEQRREEDIEKFLNGGEFFKNGRKIDVNYNQNMIHKKSPSYSQL